MSERLWVVVPNDGEAGEIEKLLRGRGEEILISRQRWGARWDGLEDGIRAELERFRRAHPEGEVIGVELAGPNPWGARNIDHHRYQDDDRSHGLSSLEQVAELLGVELDRWQQLVAANDRGYIPAMERLGASQEEIAAVRQQDRRAQGLTEVDEERARRDLAGAERRGEKVLVPCPEGTTSAHEDFLYGAAEEILLAGPKRWSYSGPRHSLLAAMGFPEENWSGGAAEGGYFGIAAPGEESRRRILEFFWADGQS
jgi:hypothetical protein